MALSKYGLSCNEKDFSQTERDLVIEMEAIRRGGSWLDKGKKHGDGLPAHYQRACAIIWPEMDWHRWVDLANQEIRRPNAKVTVLLGCGSSGKTATAAWQYMVDYYCSPNDTLVLVSSTDMRGLDLRVFGEIKMRHESAIARFPWLPGHLIDSKHCIATDNLSDSDLDDRKVRDIRRGIIGIPCIQNGKFIGLKNYVGIKQKHVRLVGDELQFMGASFLSAFTNLNNNVDFQAILLGNPADQMDSLGTAAEPVDGWSAHLEPEKTATWDTKFYNGRCINYVGTDSPNFDYPSNEQARYPYLISNQKIKETLSFYAKDSVEYYSQCKGVMKVGLMAKRVLGRELCIQFHASDDCMWDGPTKKIGALDAAYNGDRCVAQYGEFGKCVDGKIRIRLYPQEIVPIRIRSDKPMDAEEQIAVWVKEYFESKGVLPEDFFHDSTGRGSLGTALARIWSANCNPVEFGGQPTKRPVSAELMTIDLVTKSRRLKRCDEHYSKFVTELWFAVRYTVEADQMRGLSPDIIDEFCMREWVRVQNDKLEVESKADMKKRTRRSPDLADCSSILIEGARRKGFMISKMGESNAFKKTGPDWLDKRMKAWDELQAKRKLAA